MGTNYYVESVVECCPTCKRPLPDANGEVPEPRHLGKSSAGWCFSLRVYPDEGINTLEDWIRWWQGKTIRNEYGAVITEDEMLCCIMLRGEAGAKFKETPHESYLSWDHFHKENESEFGPRGMLRHRVHSAQRYSAGCIGHGAGTWDYIVGEFS